MCIPSAKEGEIFYCNEVARDNRNVLLDNACLSVEAMGNDKWLILGQEKKQTWTGEGRTSSPLWKPDLILQGRGLILDISVVTLEPRLTQSLRFHSIP